MPRCLLTTELLRTLEVHHPAKLIQYVDEEVPGFLLEFRSSGKGTWYFRHRDEQGRMRFTRIASTSELAPPEARARAFRLHTELSSGIFPARAASSHTLKAFAERRYLPHARLHKRSWETDQRLLRLHILPVLGSLRLNAVTRGDIVCWRDGLRLKGLGPSTCNRVMALLKFMFRCAIIWECLPEGKHPCQGLRALPVPPSPERYLSAEEARRLLAALDSLLPRPSACAIKMLLLTGARRQEMLSCRWEYVNWEHRLITLPQSKSGKPRHIPLSDAALDVLRTLPRRSDWLFPGKTGKGPLRSVFHTWDMLRRSLGLNDVRLHDLRHSFASFLVNQGCSLYEVQKILGHGDPRVTMRYAHLALDSQLRAANSVGRALEQKKPESTEITDKKTILPTVKVSAGLFLPYHDAPKNTTSENKDPILHCGGTGAACLREN